MAKSSAHEILSKFLPNVPTKDHHYSQEQSLLLILASALAHSPQLLRRDDVRQAVVDWFRHTRTRDNSSRDVSEETSAETPPQSDFDEQPVLERGEATRDAPEITEAATSAEEGQQAAAQECATEANPLQHEQLTDNAGTDPTSESDTDTTSQLEEGIHTRLGGILYLINVFERIGWPHDVWTNAFESPPPGPWCMIDAVGRLLIGSDFIESSTDGIWPLLAELDDRDPAELLGADLRLRNDLEVPESWMNALGEEASIGPPDELAVSRFLRANRDLGFSSVLARWLAVAFPIVKKTLDDAFDSVHEGDAVPEWMICPGTLHTTKTHIDFVSSLTNISTEARQAGIDRDPGWCPSLGRVVQFHFVGSNT